MKKYIILYLLILLISGLFSQSLPVRNYSTQDGLPQNQVNYITQDKEGYIWLRTLGGASKFDGYHFENFDLNSGIATNSLKSIGTNSSPLYFLGFSSVSLIEKNKNYNFDQNYFKKVFKEEVVHVGSYSDSLADYIFVATPSKVFYLDFRTKTFKPYFDLSVLPEKVDTPTPLFSYPDLNHIFIQLNKNAYLVNIQTKKVTNLSEKFGFSIHKDIQMVMLSLEDQKDEYMIIYTNVAQNLSYWYQYNISNGAYNAVVKGKNIVNVLCRNQKNEIDYYKQNNHLLFLDDNGSLFYYDLRSRKGYYSPQKINARHVSLLGMTDAYFLDGKLWVSTTQGLIEFDMKDNQTRVYTSENGLSNDNIQTLYVDREFNLWLGTNGSGVDMIVQGNISNYTSKNGLSHSGTTNTTEGIDGSIWVSTDNGLTRINPDRSINYYNIQENIPHKDTWALATDTKGNIWAGTYNNGLVMFDGKKFINRRPKEVEKTDSYVSEIFVDSEGNIWIMMRYYLIKYDKNYNYKYFTFNNAVTGYQIVEDETGLLWIAVGNNGIYVYNKKGEKIAEYKIDLKVFNSNIIGLEILNKKTVWCYTFGEGIIEFNRDNKTFKKIFTNELKGFGVTKAYVRDNNGNLWLGTLNGILKINKNNEVKIYKKEDGLIGNDVRTTGAYKDRHGVLWFNTSFGLVRIIAEEQNVDKTPPVMIITEFNAKQKIDLKTKDKITLAYHDNSVAFKFTGIDFRNPSRVTYSYKLENFDKEWSSFSTDRFVRYTNLNPGKYNFKVMAIDHAGNRSEIKEVVFLIKTPFWETWWFRTLIVLMLALSVYGIIIWRLNILKKKNQELENLVALRTKQLREKNEQLISSIRYAERIQKALLPVENHLKSVFKDVFIIFKPKDIISGDFYWFYESKKYYYVAVVDCTGHGVPGALLSIVGDMLLNESISTHPDSDPATLLSYMHENVRSVLCQKNERGSSRDGMEVALCRFDKQFTELMYAGANRPLYYFEHQYSEHISMIKPTRKGIGGLQKEETRVFDNHILDLNHVYCLYLFSDGYVDQNNHLNHKFGSKHLKNVLNSMKNTSMDTQKKNLLDKLSSHQESEPQRDDITIVGIKIKD